MSNTTKAARIGTILLMLFAAIGLVAILLATDYILAQPTTGQATVDRARQAQIDQQQAQTGLIVAQTGKTDAEARSIDRASSVAVFQQLTTTTLNLVICGVLALGGLGIVLAVVEWFKHLV